MPKLGNGGQQYICEILGCDPSTVRKGTLELQEEITAEERIIKAGGGKKIIETIENIDTILALIVFRVDKKYLNVPVNQVKNPTKPYPSYGSCK